MQHNGKDLCNALCYNIVKDVIRDRTFQLHYNLISGPRLTKILLCSP